MITALRTAVDNDGKLDKPLFYWLKFFRLLVIVAVLEHEPRKIAINPDRFDKLITSLRTAVDNDVTLDKEATSYNNIFDAFRLTLKFYHFEESIGSVRLLAHITAHYMPLLTQRFQMTYLVNIWRCFIPRKE